MKRYAFIVLAALVISACNSEEKPAEEVTTEPDNVEAAVVPAGNVDPICKMVKDDTWTDNTVSAAGDTVWFCSTTCKDAYVAKNK